MAKMTKRAAKVTYDFSVDGAGTGVITPAITETLPEGAIVTNVIANERTAFTSGGSATLELKCGSTALTDAVAFDSGFTAKPEVIALDNSLTAIPIAADGTITLTIAVAALLTGVCDFYVEYYY